MNQVRMVGVGLLLLAAAACGGRHTQGPIGPEYEGKHISEWADELKGGSAETRRAAAKTLAKAGKEGVDTKAAGSKLQGAVNDDDKQTRFWAAIAAVYAVKGTPQPIGGLVKAPLEEATQEGDAEVKAAAAEVLKDLPMGGGGPGKGFPGMKDKGPPMKDKGGVPPD
jgi:hypothetical protein